eukprot:gene12569-14535_t
MNLKVQKVDPYQFVNKCFTIAVVLPDSFPDISRRISNLPLKVDVCFDDETYQSESLDRNYHPNLVEVISNTNIDRSRRGLVTLRFKEPSSANSNKKYVIKFTALSLEGETTSISGYSVPIMAVRYKLKISEEFAGHGSYVWMKDVGGKDKSIDLQVGLVDANDSYVLNRRVPLRVALLYASGTPVPQQDILQLSPDSQLLIAQNGFTRIKCRINEVSSRHQGQLFQILISPESDLQSLSLGDISPAHSVPVEVKSKINFSHKRKLQALGESAAGDAARNNSLHVSGTAGAVAGKDASDPGRHVPKYDSYLGRSFDAYSSSNHSLSSSTLPGTLSNGVHAVNLGAMGPLLVQPLAPPAGSASILPLSSVLSNSSRSDNHTHSTSSSNQASALSVSSIGSNPNLSSNANGMVDAEGRPLVHALPFPQHRSNDALNEMYQRAMQFSSEAATGTTPIHGLSRTHSAPLLGPVPPIETSLWGRSSVQAAEALKDLTSWVELVYSSLREMQWTPLGQLPGAINPETGLPIAQEERLLYNMKNPNMLIESLALGYQERVLAHLTTLDSFITLRALTPKNHLHQPPLQQQVPPHQPLNEKNNHHHHHLHRPVGSYHTSPNPIAAADIEQLLQLRGAESHFSNNNTNTNTNHLTNSPLPAGGSWEHFQPQPSSPRASSRGAPGVTASGNSSVVYEQSPARIVYTDKVVYALIGPEKQELLLGFATFGSVEGALRFIGFYAMQDDGALGFKSHTELLSLRPGNRTTTTTTTSSNATTTTTSSTATTTNTSPVVSTTTTTTAEGSADPVQQLLRQISAAELHTALTVRRDSTTAAFDLSTVVQAWNKKDSAARILIYVE